MFRANVPEPKAPPRRVDWRAAEDIEAMTLAALGQSIDRIVDATRLTPSQVAYRMRKANIRLRDYRNGNPGTLGGTVAHKLLQRAVADYKPLVQSNLPRPLPTRGESRRRKVG